MIKPEVPEARETADLLNELILKSQEILKDHPVNLKRMAAGKDPANSIWPWSPGYRPAMRTMREMYGFGKGSVISAVDLIRGIGVYAGLEVLHVEGATGLYDTNYEGKAHAALEALKTNDFVYLHIEASDEAGHEGDVDLKDQDDRVSGQPCRTYHLRGNAKMGRAGSDRYPSGPPHSLLHTYAYKYPGSIPDLQAGRATRLRYHI